MKRYILITALCLIATMLKAQENTVSYSRTITKFGGAFTVGDTFTIDNIGYGLMNMTYKYFDPLAPSGPYYGFGGVDIRHTVGSVLIGDCRPVTLGWRIENKGLPGFDLSISPVLGSRSIGNTIYGTCYFGVKPTAGMFLAITDHIDIELAYEPVLNLLRFSGSDVSNETYHDFSLYVVLKQLSQKKKLDWNTPIQQEN